MSADQKKKISATLMGHPVSEKTRKQCGRIWRGRVPPTAFKDGHVVVRSPDSYLSGPRHPRWRGGANTFLSGVAHSVFVASGAKKICARCESVEDICIHHKDENRRNNDINNLQALCRPCHISHHKKGKPCGKK